MGDETRQVGGTSKTSVVGNNTYISNASLSIIGKTNLVLSQNSSSGFINIDAGGKLNTRITGVVTETYTVGQTTTIITGNQTTTTLLGVINLN